MSDNGNASTRPFVSKPKGSPYRSGRRYLTSRPGAAAMDLLNDLKAAGYKIVFMKPKFPVRTIAAYDEQILKTVKGPGASGGGRPTSSTVRTIAE
jgi:hypothetical protein